jgi:hypothetical protein
MLVKFDMRSVLANSRTVRQIIDNILITPGTSYLLNYADLKANYRFYKQDDVKNYIVLASYRDYNYSCSHNDYTLDWDMTSLKKSDIDLNKLLWHNNSRIFFMFEEMKASTLRKRN